MVVRKSVAKEGWQRMKPTPTGSGGVSEDEDGEADGERMDLAAVSSRSRAGR